MCYPPPTETIFRMFAMHHIVFLDKGSLPVTLKPLQSPHSWHEHAYTGPDDIVPRLQGASIAVVNKVRLTESVLAALPDLKMIAIAATGSDNVDLAYCKAKGIVVSNIRNYALDSVPEHVLAMLFALRRSLPGWQKSLSAGEWQTAQHFCLFDYPILDIAGSTLGIIGSGSLGQSLAKKAQALGMRVLFAERKGASDVRDGFTAFDDVLRQSDAISLHCPLTPQTKDLMAAREFALMQPHAILLNTARGALVHADDLLAALQSGQIGGAGIDVLPEEPPRQGHPFLDVSLPNLMVTPHVAWSSQQAMRKLADQLVDNMDAFIAGTPQNQLT